MATHTMESYQEDSVVHMLNELFGNVLNVDIIKKVATSCHFDIQESSNKLLEITANTSDPPNEINSSECNVSSTVDHNKIVNGFDNEASQIHKAKSFATLCRSISPSQRAVVSSPKTVKFISSPKKSKKSLEVEKAINHILIGYKVLIILRGLPGSGKSYLAKQLVEKTVGRVSNLNHILSSDDYFITHGKYQYDSTKLQDAHGWNQYRAFQSLGKGISPIIIDNTNTQMWEMKPYAAMATDYGYIIYILEPDTHWFSNEKELSRRNSHGVTKQKIRDMWERYEKNITPAKLLSAYNFSYKLQKPPQNRIYPPMKTTEEVKDPPQTNPFLTNGFASNVASNIAKSRSVASFNSKYPYELINSTSEIIDLMDFNDDSQAAFDERPFNISNSGKNGSSKTLSSVDDILMWSSNPTSTVLQPSKLPYPVIVDEITIDSSSNSSDENNLQNRDRGSLNNIDIETAWGVNEKALQSWDIVTPLEESHTSLFHNIRSNRSAEREIVKVEASCNTSEGDFHLLEDSRRNIKGLNFLVAKNRDINFNTPLREARIPKKIMLDKSCLTETQNDDTESHMYELITMFPSLRKSVLKYFYRKCKGDLEWTIDLLLENDMESKLNEFIEHDIESDDEIDNMPQSSINENNSNMPPIELNLPKELKVPKRKSTSEGNVELKKCIESKVNISDNYYSDRLKQVRHQKFGPKDPKPSTSKSDSILTEAGEVLMVDSDIEFDEDSEESCEKINGSFNDMVELNLGDTFVSQLEANFGDSRLPYPKGFQPVVQVPVALARQIYTFYMESVFQQMEAQNQVLDTLIKEDEEFAKKLQAQEQERPTPSAPVAAPDLEEIMNEEAAMNVYRRDTEVWKNMTPDDLASKMTRQKLFNIFPMVDRSVLVEVLHAHNNSYNQTIESLLASVTPENVRANEKDIHEAPIDESTVNEMKEAEEVCKNMETSDDERHEPIYYREVANKYLKTRTDLYQKAQLYYQRGMTEVAQFYSVLAKKQTTLYDRANNMAATAFLDEHSKRLQDFDTLDLHFLYVKEAIPALDLFIDRNINLLNGSSTKQTQCLNIITGRGKRSENGLSKIKPAVISRLKKRQIKFVQLNPGLLKIKIQKTSQVTSDLT